MLYEVITVHIYRVVLLQHFAKLGSYPLRQNARHLCAKPDNLYMRNLSQARKNFLQHVIRKHQGVAAGEYYVVDFRMLLKVLECAFKLLHVNFA